MPYISYGIAIAMRWQKKIRDTSCGKVRTKKTGRALYKDVYFGPDYVLHFKYSGVLNSTYVTLTYGMGLPILFPITAINIFNQWICERLTVAYISR